MPTFSGNAGTVPAGTLAWPAGVPTFTGSALAAHAHELPFQLVSGTSIRHLPSTTFGTGTSRAAQGGIAPTANTTSAAVALSESKSAGTPAGTIAWPAGVPTVTTVSFTPTGTLSWPAGVPTNGAVSFTPAGTIAWPAAAPGFSGNALGTHSHTLTPAGTVSQPTFTGDATSVVQPSIAVYAWKRTA